MHDARLYSYYSYSTCMYDWFVLGEVFGCVLSLYMGGKEQPLPTDEEVIVCDENTTAEEVHVGYNLIDKSYEKRYLEIGFYVGLYGLYGNSDDSIWPIFSL